MICSDCNGMGFTVNVVAIRCKPCDGVGTLPMGTFPGKRTPDGFLDDMPVEAWHDAWQDEGGEG